MPIDSYASLQAMIDGPGIAEIPAGYYYLSQPLIARQPKVIRMGQPLLQPYNTNIKNLAGRGPGPLVPESHTRLWADQNCPLFIIQSPEVFIEGGVCDVQACVNRTAPIVEYKNCIDHNGRVNGWGGGIDGTLLLGNYLDLGASEGAGCDGVLMNFDATTLANAYWTHMRFRLRGLGLKCVWRSTPRNESLQHWANTTELNIQADYCKQAIVNESFTGLVAEVKHQARAVYATSDEMEKSPSVRSRYGVQLVNPSFFDFNKPAESVGSGRTWHRNKYTVELDGEDNIIDDTSATTFSLAKQILSVKPRHRLDGASGFIPRLASNQDDGVVIPELHDALFAVFKSAEKSILGYSSVENLPNLTVPSTGAASSGVTILRPERLFEMNGTFTEIKWTNPASNDYAEIVVRDGLSIRDIWISMTRTPRQMQLILLNAAGGVIHNETRTMPNAPSLYVAKFETNYEPFKTMIVRFIGCHSASIIPHGIVGIDSRHIGQNPLVHV